MLDMENLKNQKIELITLYGGNPIPVAAIYKQFCDNIQSHTILYDVKYNQSRNFSDFNKGIRNLHQKYSNDIPINFIQYDEDNLNEILGIIKLLKSKSLKNHVLIHISDINSATGLVMSSRLSDDEVSFVIYDEEEAEFTIYGGDTMRVYPISNYLDVDDFITSQGFTLEYEISRDEREKRKNFVYNIFDNTDRFLKFREKVIYSYNLSSLSYYTDIYENFSKLGAIYNDGSFDKNYIEGGIFEEYIANVLSDIGFDDVISSADIIFQEVENGNPVKNEIDVIGTFKNKLTIVECKFNNSHPLTNLIYKYGALYERLKGKLKVLLIYYKKDFLLKYNELQRKNYKLRAKIFDIHIYENFDVKRGDLETKLKKLYKIQ